MKNLIIIAICAVTLIACHNANNGAKAPNVSVGNEKKAIIPSADAPIIAFEREVFDFGKIVEGEKVQHDFKFINKGKTPLIITEAIATCGCTMPEVPKEPILPGGEGTVKVIFSSQGKMGIQDKVITITSNANPSQSMVHLVGEVVEKN
ncbi:DUF1573 domain-containing protein [Pedobacter changchengzhani]|uniref:DUF1573 domain-containing protein n=1 Tax=Pedobacter changchengzhani TaxID=2529274 RepID=A0A4R5MK21_9SPHI|nr:DUF1573 domain-containing protein [Pedobacter changchengzhani]TDG36037.1 DUF1573 domain-containing protein [Pedobacter changchengzhani]